RVQVHTSSTDIGQGTHIAFEMIVADALGVPPALVHMPLPDTREVPDSGPTVASRTIMVVGGVLGEAAAKLRIELEDFVSGVHGVQAKIEGGLFLGPGGRQLTTFEAAARALREVRGAERTQATWQPMRGQDFDETTYRGMAYPAFGWGCDVVEVEVDP